ncbi:MAG: hypothetical protein IT372_31600 [Polyangiaceae bacterium]|nr:hypothetical protein [Polyangiaceae bacterium]
MSRYVSEYAPFVLKLRRDEACYSGPEREMVGVAAIGIARFLRRRAPVESDCLEILALADEAEQVGEICLNHPEPIGRE